MLKGIIPFYLFLPTMVGYFAAFAFSRTSDLTWGNRPSDSLKSLQSNYTELEKKKMVDALERDGNFICWFILLLNLLASFLVGEGQLKSYFLLALAFAILAWSAIQIFFSFFFFIKYQINNILYSLKKRALICWHSIDAKEFYQVQSNFDPKYEQPMLRDEGLSYTPRISISIDKNSCCWRTSSRSDGYSQSDGYDRLPEFSNS